jgi:hypothetical protein
MAYYTILIPSGLSGKALRRAKHAGPPAGAPLREHQAMLRSAGFVEIAETDVTHDYLVVAQAMFEARERHSEELRRAHGDEWVKQKFQEDRTKLAAIEEGSLRRSLFVAARGR